MRNLKRNSKILLLTCKLIQININDIAPKRMGHPSDQGIKVELRNPLHKEAIVILRTMGHRLALSMRMILSTNTTTRSFVSLKMKSQ
jgi:hypothetical protein